MVGLERSTLPLIGREDFGLASKRRGAVVHRRLRPGQGAHQPRRRRASPTALGRRRLLIAGWALALPVPLLIALAPSWGWIVAANVLLGVNQGLAWSMTVVMKIDLVGPERRGLALGLNEAAGYGGVALAAAAERAGSPPSTPPATCSSSPARSIARHRARGVGRSSSATPPRTSRSSRPATTTPARRPPPLRTAFPDATWRAPALRACSQAGLVNNLNDALAWGLVPLFLAAHGASVGRDRPRRRPVPGRVGRRPDLDRPLVRPRRAQAADRRGHAAASRRAGAARRLRRRGRRRRAQPPSRSASAPRSSTRR